MSSSVSLNPAVNDALSQLGTYVASKKKAGLEKPLLERLEQLTQDEKKLLAESLENDVQRLNALKKIAKKSEPLFKSFVEVVPDFTKTGANDTSHSNAFVAAGGDKRNDKIVSGNLSGAMGSIWTVNAQGVVNTNIQGVNDDALKAVTGASAATAAAGAAEAARATAARTSDAAQPSAQEVSAHAQAAIDHMADPSRGALAALQARRAEQEARIKDIQANGTAQDKKSIPGLRAHISKLDKQIKQMEASVHELGKAEAGLRDGGKKAMSLDEAMQLYIDHKMHGKPLTAEQQQQAAELIAANSSEFKSLFDRLPPDLRTDFDAYTNRGAQAVDPKKPSDLRIVSHIQQGMLKKLGESHPDLARGVQDRLRQLEEFNRNSERTHTEMMSLLNSGLPIEVVMMLVMGLLTQREEEKFRLKMSEVALAEQFERVREKVEHQRNVVAPYRERLAKGQGIDDLPKLNIDGKDIIDPADIERIYSAQPPSPADFGMSTKSTQALMQELEVSQQRFNQMMQLLSAVIRQFQDLTATIIRNIRT